MDLDLEITHSVVIGQLNQRLPGKRLALVVPNHATVVRVEWEDNEGLSDWLDLYVVEVDLDIITVTRQDDS